MLTDSGGLGTTMAASTTVAKRWLRTSARLPAANQQGEGGFGSLAVWIGGGMRSWRQKGSRVGEFDRRPSSGSELVADARVLPRG